MGAADGVQPAQFGAAVAALPSGLLEMVGMAIMALESKFEARATYRMAARVAHWRPACEVQRKSKQCRANRIRSPVTASAAEHSSAGTCRGADGCSNRRESAQAQWEIGAIRAHTVAQLKVLCAQHGLRKTGTKAELVARLSDALCVAEPAAKRPRTRGYPGGAGFTASRFSVRPLLQGGPTATGVRTPVGMGRACGCTCQGCRPPRRRWLARAALGSGWRLAGAAGGGW